MTEVFVTGGSPAALAAALDIAEVGVRVRVALGSDLRDWPSEPQLDVEGGLTSLMERLAEPIAEGGNRRPGLKAQRLAPEPVLLPAAKGGQALQPWPNVVGVPAVPLAATAIVGGSGAFRAYLDRLKPLLTIGKTREFGALVRARMGSAAKERLVEPQVRERFGVAADEAQTAVIAPGLNEALTRAGSLSGAALACSERYVARETRVVPAEGWSALREALLERLKLYDVEFAEGTVAAVSPEGDGWSIEQAEGSISVRAVVLDLARNVAPPPEGVAAFAEALVAHRVRAYAEGPIAKPEWWPADAWVSAALRTVVIDEGQTWSMRVERRVSGDWRAELRGPASECGSAGSHDRLQKDLAEVKAAADIVAVEPGWTTQWTAAPHVDAELRDAEKNRIDRLYEAAGVLPVGSRIHGDDLSAAVVDARIRAVAMRRKLTGIAE